MRCLVVSLAALFAVLSFSQPAQAQYKAGDWELTLNGSGFSDRNLNDSSFAITVAPSYFMSKEVEVGLRQSFNYADGFNGITTVFADYNFNLDINGVKLVPYLGGSLGYSYGDSVSDAWRAGPEAGVKWFYNDSTFFFAQAAYLFDLNQGFSEGGFFYGLGIGLKL